MSSLHGQANLYTFVTLALDAT